MTSRFHLPFRPWVLCTAAALCIGARSAQSQADTRTVDGIVMHGEPKGPRSIGNVRVVLHRVGPDRAGPLDSMLTDAKGRYHFRYTPSGSPEAIYFVSASYDGIAYFSIPLREPVTRGEDAQITVFDTTSSAVPIHVLGHHIILGAPNPQGRREAVEVFELGNDTSVTRVSGSAHRPVWEGALPRGATDAKLNPTGEIAPNAVSFANGRVRLFAPLSPGSRQVSYAYQIPKNALPVTYPVEQPTGVLEVLLEEPRAKVAGAGLAEVQPTTASGRAFRRYLAQNVSGQAAVQIDIPFAVEDARSRFLFAIAIVSTLAMLGAVFYAARRPRAFAPALAPHSAHAPATEVLLHAIAQLDARFEQSDVATDDGRAEYEAERARLKSRLADALAEERQPG